MGKNVDVSRPFTINRELFMVLKIPYFYLPKEEVQHLTETKHTGIMC